MLASAIYVNFQLVEEEEMVGCAINNTAGYPKTLQTNKLRNAFLILSIVESPA